MDVLEPGDLELAYAIRRASTILVKVASDLRAAAEDGVTSYLIEYLRSDKPLSSGDRDILADLLQGVLSRPPGRPENSTLKSRRREVKRDFARIRETGGTPNQAWIFLAARALEQFGIDAFAEYGFKVKTGDVDDLAQQFSDWDRRPASRK